MKTLDAQTIMNIVKNIRNGTVARVTYKSDVPVKAEFKKLGYQVTKFTDTTCRFGVKYSNIKAVMNRKANEPRDIIRNYSNNYQWLIDNKVKHNTNTNKDYLVMANFNKGHHTKTLFRVTQVINNLEITQTLTKDEFMNTYADIIQNSYFNHSATGGEVRTVAFDNVIRINDIGEKVAF